MTVNNPIVEMITIEITVGPEAYKQADYIYVWRDESGPIYVGETAQGLADRTGLHIRAPHRSGAIVAQQIKAGKRQKYTVMAFAIDQNLMSQVSKRLSGGDSPAGRKRARLAIERSVYNALISFYPKIKLARRCKWDAPEAKLFVGSIKSSIASLTGSLA
jgi:hypothetical protein